MHHADCYTINGQPPRGRTWTGPYVKICSPSLGPLDQWAVERTGSPIRRCGTCQPPSTATAADTTGRKGRLRVAGTIMSSSWPGQPPVAGRQEPEDQSGYRRAPGLPHSTAGVPAARHMESDAARPGFQSAICRTVGLRVALGVCFIAVKGDWGPGSRCVLGSRHGEITAAQHASALGPAGPATAYATPPGWYSSTARAAWAAATARPSSCHSPANMAAAGIPGYSRPGHLLPC